MILNSLNLSSVSPLKTKLVPVPQFGEDAEVMMTQLDVKGRIRKEKLSAEIVAREDLTEAEKTGLLMCAAVSCAMIDPETRGFLVQESDIEAFYNTISEQTLMTLILALNELNEVSVDEKGQTLASKKKKS